MLMSQYDKLVAYLEEKEYHGDTELQALVDRLGSECQEAEETTDELNERLNERPGELMSRMFGRGDWN